MKKLILSAVVLFTSATLSIYACSSGSPKPNGSKFSSHNSKAAVLNASVSSGKCESKSKCQSKKASCDTAKESCPVTKDSCGKGSCGTGASAKPAKK